MKRTLFATCTIFYLVVLGVFLSSCSKAGKLSSTKVNIDTIYSNVGGKGIDIKIDFQKGRYHNHPTFAIWVEDMEENYIQTLFVTKSLATGIFGHGPINDSIWGTKPGEAFRPAALPYWNHKRIKQEGLKTVPTPENPIPDAYSGATPDDHFLLVTKTDENVNRKFRLVLEINQTWDWNEYWTNNKYPDDTWYKSSSQPSVVYAVTIDPEKPRKEYHMNPIGHGHYAGRNGELYTDLTTLTTALKIVENIIIRVE